jgi:hypothetical protein
MVEGIFAGDPLLSCVARVTLLYYMGVWAIVSTLMIYLVARFGLSQVSIMRCSSQAFEFMKQKIVV